ncbi:DUF1707 SHOCT-like domain-containing protein [Herbiconiux flava]|uniref:DUF1707 domain-containing protein n=1 Tax=Herbiconiux flava TaxID=881268 RepID=A0A852SBD7_9MICO|nr:DUF1707 domain-containing protein [Herbiconiux flava]NYD69706.1 hypothetical protein [Herbiconiux flava]GLK16453.1 hypothetical protein GCM10017602_09350 [Herbiconiux flava]
MSYDDARTSHLRLSHADRDAAIAALARAEAEGRLTADELAERTAAAGRAVVRGDLAPLFTDLPDTDAGPLADPAAPAAPSASAPGVDSAPAGPPANPAFAQAPGYGGPGYGAPGYGGPGYGAGYDYSGRSTGPAPLGGAAGVVAVSVTPLIALGLFLACGFLIPGGFAWSWVFWLFVPIVGIVVWGPAGRGHDHR